MLSKVLESIDIAKEIADGLRVIFDFNLLGILLYGSHGEVKQYNEVMKPGKVQKQRTLITKPNLSIPTKIMMPPASVRNRRQSSTTIDHTLQGSIFYIICQENSESNCSVFNSLKKSNEKISLISALASKKWCNLE